MALAYTHLGLNSTGDTRLSTGSLFRVMVVKSLRDLSGVATSATVWSSITASAPGDNLHLISDSRQPASSLLDPATDTRLVKQFWLRASNPTTALISGDTVSNNCLLTFPSSITMRALELLVLHGTIMFSLCANHRKMLVSVIKRELFNPNSSSVGRMPKKIKLIFF